MIDYPLKEVDVGGERIIRITCSAKREINDSIYSKIDQLERDLVILAKKVNLLEERTVERYGFLINPEGYPSSVRKH